LLVELAKEHLIDSAHDCSDGGLAVALAEAGFDRGLGSKVNISSEESTPYEFLLFGEEASRVVISCDREQASRIQKLAVKYRISALLIGETVPEQLTITANGTAVVSARVSDLKEAWEHALERALHVETEERLVPNVVQRS
jgi:phosphoribosylformylglycinamidine synthase